MKTEPIKRITYVPALCEYDEFISEEKTWKMIHYMTWFMKQTYDKIKDTHRFKHLDALFSEVVKNMPNTPVDLLKRRGEAVVDSKTYRYTNVSVCQDSGEGIAQYNTHIGNPIEGEEGESWQFQVPYPKMQLMEPRDFLLKMIGDQELSVATVKSRNTTADPDVNYHYCEFPCIDLGEDIDDES